MDKTKLSSVAGTFYTDDKEELKEEIKNYADENHYYYKVKTRAVIVPHAGHFYSGQLAYEGLSYLKPAKNIFIFAPSHHIGFKGLSLSSYTQWQTPLGNVDVNQDICKELEEKFECKFYDDAFAEEHSVEVQVPFLQTLFPDEKIVPILVGSADIKQITKIIEYYWQNSENVFVISSDLSHFYTSDEAGKIDSLTAEMIETQQTDDFSSAQACGYYGVLGLMEFVKSKEFSMIRVGLKNSGDITGDTSKVVGYGSWILSECSTAKFLKQNFKFNVTDAARCGILSELNNEKMVKIPIIPPVFQQSGACFVTLTINGQLRGCIGSIIAHQSYVEDIVRNARSAAFRDPRFSPITKEEFKKIKIEVSLLSAPQKMTFTDEEDLISQIEPFVDGIIIKDEPYQAVYLPSVWEQLPEKRMFLKSLKIKAGMTPEHFSKTFKAYKFFTEMVSE